MAVSASQGVHWDDGKLAGLAQVGLSRHCGQTPCDSAEDRVRWRILFIVVLTHFRHTVNYGPIYKHLQEFTQIFINDL